MSFDDLARVLDPAREDYDRPMTELIDSLRSAPEAKCEARLQNVEAVRGHILSSPRSPSTTRYIDGREDGYRYTWCKIDPPGLEYI